MENLSSLAFHKLSVKARLLTKQFGLPGPCIQGNTILIREPNTTTPTSINTLEELHALETKLFNSQVTTTSPSVTNLSWNHFSPPPRPSSRTSLHQPTCSPPPSSRNPPFIKIASVNINRLSAQYHDLLPNTAQHNCDIIAITETFLTTNTLTHIYDIPGYNLVHHDRIEKEDSGVFIYYRNYFIIKVLRTSSPGSLLWAHSTKYLLIKPEKLTLDYSYHSRTSTIT